MNSPLHGVRVVDFTTTIAGPHCTRLLADVGAEVIKLEAPDGDMMRSRPPLRNGASTSFGQLNTGKKSVILDLKRPEALKIVRRLVATADVLVENFRPGVMPRFGLDYPALKAAKPDLVYCAISGYGQTGPSAELPAYAPVIHAASGYDLAHLAYQGGDRRPDYCGIFIADVVTGTYAFGAIMTALYQRQQTGEGQLIDVSMLESMLSLTLSEMQLAQFPASYIQGRPIFGPIATKDGWINIGGANQANWERIATVIGLPKLIADPRFKTNADRMAHKQELAELIAARTRTRSSADWILNLEASGVPVGPINKIGEMLSDPQVAARAMVVEVNHPKAGKTKALGLPIKFSDTPGSVRSAAPLLGQHTRVVLLSLGYSDKEIKALEKSGAVACA